MKIDRLLGIVITLLLNEKVTAPYLAQKYEVSRRTINRDIDTLCNAGIPIITNPGINGGISISSNYKLDKSYLTDNELSSIFAGLSALNSVSENYRYRSLIDKLSNTNKNSVLSNYFLINLSSHYKNSLIPKIETIQTALENTQAISFTYYKKDKEQNIILYPHRLVFQWSSWYVLGISENCDKFKLYKLNRLSHLKILHHTFDLQKIPDHILDFDSLFSNNFEVTILFDKSVKSKLIEEYDTDCFLELPNSQLLFTFSFTNEDYLLEWVLSFGDKAELILPERLRQRIKTELSNCLKKYL